MSIELLQRWLRPARRLLVAGCIVAGGWRAFASDLPARLSPVAQFPIPVSPYALIQAAQPQMPLTLVGPRGAFLGQQSGNLEAWIFPVKLFSNFHISARLQNYPVDIDVTELASTVDVEPDHTTITYSHAAFTVHEILFAAQQAADGTGVMALFQIESVRPLRLTFSLTPELKRAWPAPNYGGPYPEWVPTADNSGYYILHMDFPDLAAALALPGAQPGILQPYQERPHVYPLQFVLHFDPEKDRGVYFPLLMAVGNTAAQATNAELARKLVTLDANVATMYSQEAASKQHFFDHRLTIETPDVRLNLAYKWALLAIDQDKIRLPSDGEVGLAAGFYPSGDSARPGFGWFFGRDALWTAYALNAEGDFASTRQALEFLLRRQRADGKVMHEYSQTAQAVDWKSFPYEYAAADATPLLLMATADYYRASGDVEFLRAHWQQLQKAWQFEERGDTDGDGIYDNANGTGWVESWPGGMPHQEIYLALLDQQASTAMMRMASAVGDAATQQSAASRASRIGQIIPNEYKRNASGIYAFSRNANGSLDSTSTIYPTVAWWDGTYALPDSGEMLQQWASKDFSTDWGTRDLSDTARDYDPLSYHQGSVWPLFTGWTSLAEYRVGQPLSGYAHLMQNAELTYAQDLGGVTELLSGAFYQTFGRSTSHQLWSSAMVVSPLLRGLFGLEWDAPLHTLFMTPHLPADWDAATLRHVAVGENSVDVSLQRQPGSLLVELHGDSGPVRLASRAAGAKILTDGRTLRIPLSPVEVFLPQRLPEPGSRTKQPKILAETTAARSYTILLEAQAGAQVVFHLRINDATVRLKATGATVETVAGGRQLVVQLPPGQGYVQHRVALSW